MPLVALSARTGESGDFTAAWLHKQTPPTFKPGHTLLRLGQMHCINPPVEVRTELARNWGFAVRVNRPQGEPELIWLCRENPDVFKPAAMIGGVTTGEFNVLRYESFDPAQPPKWLDQMLTVAHAHALFSWSEADLRDSRLLPGPQPHAWSKDQPAYEFPTGHKDTRVLVRRANDASRWLIGAWAADGIEREVTVTVPDFGDYRICARPAGTLHAVTLSAGQRNIRWLDEDAMNPSRTANQTP